ncbi:MAG: tetratricopeptide repeat protein, partial [Nitrospinota bacterium]|nr:tetratricopeptide repeat protein [Nitrospinota bacterium]
TLEEKIINIINPPSYIKLIKKGEEFFKQGEYEKALTIFQDVLKTKPESSGIRLLIGRVHESLKNDEKALQFYNEAVDKNPQFLRAHKTLAKFYMNKGDKKSALKSFENAVKISPTNANRQLMIGKIALEVDKDKHKAEKAFEAAAKQAPELTKEIAEVYLSNGCPQKAENFFRDSLANEESVPLYNRLGIALRKQGKWGKAIEEYQKALKVEPNNETVFFNMGMAYIDGNKIDCDKKQDALKCLKMALKIRPDFKEAKEKLNNLLKVKSK